MIRSIKPPKNQNRKFQFVRKITLVDYVPVFAHVVCRDNPATHEARRIPFGADGERQTIHLHSLCAFVHMMRDAYWTAAKLRLRSFHSPAAAASELLKMIDVRGHSWPVKSVDLDYEQEIAHAAYFAGRFECMVKGYSEKGAYQYDYDLASADPYAMQFLPSMKGGRWEKWNLDNSMLGKLTKKHIEESCILSILRVRFCFFTDTPFYPLPWRRADGVILYPRVGYGYYMRDDVLAAIAWCKKFKIPVEKALIIEEANFFHPAPDAVYPFTPIADAYMKRIEFDKKDPKGPEQLALKLAINSCYGKLAGKKFRGLDPKTGEPIIPPHACPWCAAAITAHTRRELMIAALRAPELITQIATDAIYSGVPLALPRLKAEADIKAERKTNY